MQVHAGSQAQQGAVKMLDMPDASRDALLAYNIGRMVTIQAEREVRERRVVGRARRVRHGARRR